MSFTEWKDKTAAFKTIDVRGIQGNFFQGLKKQAMQLPAGNGLDSAALDDVFELLAWNQGIGYFSSEIGPSTLFAAYKTIKTQEKQGRERSEICEMLKEKFGEKNPDVKV